jgi:rare lipoprotein A
MSKVHCVGGHSSDQITGFAPVIRIALYGVVMSLGRLWRYFGTDYGLVLRDWSILLAAVVLPLAPCSASAQNVPDTRASWVTEAGAASYYSSKYQGRRAADGTRFDQRKMTAAHSWLPFGTKVRVTVPGTGRSVIVTITDRLRSKHFVIDLSTAAAQLLGMMRGGVTQVSLSPA